MPDLIIFNFIAINGMQSNAAMMVGDNVASGWDSPSKNQLSQGLIFGAANAFPASFNLINENDFVDVPIVDYTAQPQKNVQV